MEVRTVSLHPCSSGSRSSQALED